MVNIKTNRLILRQWIEADFEPFAALNADPRVREFFSCMLSREESDESIKVLSGHISKYGWGLWAASLLENDEFIGFIGLQNVPFNAHFTPAVEIGWRLAHKHWGKGFATEGAKAALKFGFESIELNKIVSFTTVNNLRSRHVMAKIGMHHDQKDDFDHPNISSENPMKKHVLYQLHREEWNTLQ